MVQIYISAQSAMDNAEKNDYGEVRDRSSSFTCPYNDCRTFALQHWGSFRNVSAVFQNGWMGRDLGIVPAVSASRCSACDREALYIGGKIVLPSDSDAPAPAEDLPGDCLVDFEEARTILPNSPRGTAALLRLVIQKLLPHLGATKHDINAGIGELVKEGIIKSQIQKALDTVRVIGNESVHPGEMDLKDDRETALTLFKIINLIVETQITEPKRLDAIYDTLPQNKRDGIENRDS